MATEAQELTPLGERVEHTLIELIEAGLRHGPVEKLSIADCAPCQEALAVAHSRIRERLDEPRPEPASETLEQLVARMWPEDAPIVKLREIAQILLDASLDPRNNEVQLGRWLEYHLDRLDAPQPTRAVFVEEPKPQHVFERHRLGEPLRTSKHSHNGARVITDSEIAALRNIACRWSEGAAARLEAWITTALDKPNVGA